MELARSAPRCRTGAINSARWKASDGLWRSYAYTYDRAGRLAAADKLVVVLPAMTMA